MQTHLTGRTALITGASSGLGADFARILAGMGANLVLVARRQTQLEALRQEILTRHDVKIATVTLDLTEPNGPRLLHERLRGAGTDVDILINNAGFGLSGPFLEQEWARLENMIDLDITVLTRLTRLFAPEMVARRSGWILQIASVAAFQPVPGFAAYAAAKAYVRSFSEALYFELKPHGVTCTLLSPGATRTEFFDVAGANMAGLPQRILMESPAVARIGIQGLLAGKRHVVPGTMNQVVRLLSKVLPRGILAGVVSRAMGRG